MKDLHVPLLDINPEGKLQREVKDILEELHIMLHINRSHRDVLKDFIINVEHILDPKGAFGPKKRFLRGSVGLGTTIINHNTYTEPSNHRETSSDKGKGKESEGADSKDGNKDKKTKGNERPIADAKEDFDWFKLNADELLDKMNCRIEELEILTRTAEDTSNNVSINSNWRKERTAESQD